MTDTTRAVLQQSRDVCPQCEILGQHASADVKAANGLILGPWIIIPIVF